MMWNGSWKQKKEAASTRAEHKMLYNCEQIKNSYEVVLTSKIFLIIDNVLLFKKTKYTYNKTKIIQKH